MLVGGYHRHLEPKLELVVAVVGSYK